MLNILELVAGGQERHALCVKCIGACCWGLG